MNSIDQHTIDEYLLKRLEGDELKAFEQLLAIDANLAAEVSAQRQAIGVIDIVGDIQMKERVKRIHDAELGFGGKPAATKSRWKWVVLVIALLIVSFGIWLLLRPKVQTPAQLYAEYYKPYDLSFGSRDADAIQTLSEAGSLYKSGKYAEALPLFEQVVSTHPTDSKARLAAAICHLELGQNDQALVQLDKLIEDPLFNEQALWYSAMAKLGQERVVEARGLLLKLQSDYPTSVFSKDAAQLLENLGD